MHFPRLLFFIASLLISGTLQKEEGNVVHIDFIGSSRCSLCTAFLRNHLTKVYPRFYQSGRLNVTYIPYTQLSVFRCASDIAALQACYMEEATGPEMFQGLLDIQTSGSVETALERCYSSLNQQRLKSCATGREGRKLLGKHREAALEIVYGLGITLWRYPLLVVDGQRNRDTEVLKRNLVGGLCDMFFQPKAAEC